MLVISISVDVEMEKVVKLRYAPDCFSSLEEKPLDPFEVSSFAIVK